MTSKETLTKHLDHRRRPHRLGYKVALPEAEVPCSPSTTAAVAAVRRSCSSTVGHL